MCETLVVKCRRIASRWMRSSRVRVALVSVLSLCLGQSTCVGGEGSLSQDAQRELIDRIVSQWTKRHNAIDTLMVEVEGETLTPKGRFTGEPNLPEDISGEFPPKDHKSPLATRWWIDFRRNRVRIETDTEIFYVNGGEFQPRKGIAVFDGNNVIRQNLAVTENLTDHSPIQPEIYVQDASYEMFETLDRPILYFRGVVPPGTSFVTLGNMNSMPEADSFEYAGETSWKGYNCVIIRTLPVRVGSRSCSEFWVDVEHDSVIRRWFLRNGKAAVRMVDIDYRKENDRWAPSAWKVVHFKSDGRLRTSQDVVVKKFEINPAMSKSEDLFVLQPSSGMVVQDEVAGYGYRLAEDGETKLRPDGLPLVEPSSPAGFIARLALAIGTPLLIILIVVRARLRGRKT